MINDMPTLLSSAHINLQNVSILYGQCTQSTLWNAIPITPKLVPWYKATALQTAIDWLTDFFPFKGVTEIPLSFAYNCGHRWGTMLHPRLMCLVFMHVSRHGPEPP